ncbi:MAG: hypothetical protein ACRBBQ_00520 [Cognatishimia sp.]
MPKHPLTVDSIACIRISRRCSATLYPTAIIEKSSAGLTIRRPERIGQVAMIRFLRINATPIRRNESFQRLSGEDFF